MIERSGSPIRVLVVDDDEDDFLITRARLREIEGTRFEVDCVDDGDVALARLAAGRRYDICLLDYRLGRKSGLDLLRSLTAAGNTLPIILLTGQEDREVDREAVRLGASDYLVKGQIDATLLERSIRYALRQKRTEEALRRQSEFVSAVLNSAGALVIVLDREGRVERFNRACETATGFSFAELEGRPIWDCLLPAEEHERVRRIFASVDQVTYPKLYESDWVTREGGRRRIAWSNAAIAGPDDRIEHIVSVGTDVTEQRRTEAALAEAREREIAVGAGIQKTLLVRRPPEWLSGLEIGWKNAPSQRVGGDYLDFVAYHDTCFDLLVGDVMGKGVPAALLAAATKSHFQRVIRRLGLDLARLDRLPQPEEVVAAVHALLTPELVELDSFVTLAYARFDTERRLLTFVDCGHPRPLHVDARTGECRRLSGENMPLGMNEGEKYRQTVVEFGPGDLFVFYSDGITEACSAGDELFGEERLARLICENRDRSPQEVADMACDAATGLRAGSPYEDDDLTCVVVRILPEPMPRRRRRAEIEVASDPYELERVRGFVERFCAEVGRDILEERESDRLMLALHEAAANVFRHAYRGQQDGRLWVAAEEFDDRIRFSLRDNGDAFTNFSDTPPPAFDGSRDSGFGLFLMRQCLDEIEYVRDELGRNALTLIKRLPGAREGRAQAPREGAHDHDGIDGDARG
jgi:sigma-B regulation protein RsbU (phosphoserine phosphatase)